LSDWAGFNLENMAVIAGQGCEVLRNGTHTEYDAIDVNEVE
jgi:hypothetical protein